MEHQITGRCLCGATQYSVSGPGKFGIICYCTDCQRVTGTGGAPQLAVSTDDFRVDGSVKSYVRKADSGSDLAFQFCGECGSPVFKTTGRAPDLVFFYAGTLDQTEVFSDPKPVFEDSRLSWDR